MQKPTVHTVLIVLIFSATAVYLGTVFSGQPKPAAQEVMMDVRADDTRLEDLVDAGALHIPLEETTELREELKREIAARNSYVLRDLYEKYLPLVGANGLTTAVQEAYPGCHDEAHDLGKVLYDATGQVGSALRACNNACHSGCMHGALMEAFASGLNAEDYEHLSIDDVLARARTVCEGDQVQSAYPKGDCLHGVGHALMYLSKYDVDASMEYCRRLSSGPEAYYCATGAYMEYVGKYHARDAKEQPLFYPCDRSDFPAACFRYKFVPTFYEHYLTGAPTVDIINKCLELDAKHEVGCFHGIGNAHMGYIITGQVSFDELCSYGDRDDQYACIEGAIERMARYYPEKAEQACGQLSGWKLDVCEAGRKNGLYSLTKPFDLYL